MADFEVLLSKQQIDERLDSLAREINEAYNGEELLVVGVLNGSFIFCADLVRRLTGPVKIDFIQASSYEGTESTGEVKITKDLKHSIKGKNVLLVEDIVDTGLTIKSLFEILGTREAKSIKLVSLLFKPSRAVHKVNIDFLAFEIEDKFVIGYGLDFNDDYRQLPYIGIYNDGGH